MIQIKSIGCISIFTRLKLLGKGIQIVSHELKLSNVRLIDFFDDKATMTSATNYMIRAPNSVT